MSETVGERLDRARRRAVEQVAEVEAEAALVPLLPIEPYMIHSASRAEPWVSYKAADIAAALVILDAFQPLAASCVEAGCVYLGPDAVVKAGPSGKLRWDGPEVVAVVLEHYGRSHRTQEVQWWSPLGDRVARITVEVASWPWSCLASCEVRWGSDGHVTSARHELRALGEWRRIKWGAGSPESCRFGLYFDTKATARAWLAGLLVEVPR